MCAGTHAPVSHVASSLSSLCLLPLPSKPPSSQSHLQNTDQDQGPDNIPDMHWSITEESEKAGGEEGESHTGHIYHIHAFTQVCLSSGIKVLYDL